MPAPTLESAFVRILINDSAGRAAAGAGFLAAPRHVLTCAHVVNTALRRGQTAPEQPDTLFALDFPLLPDQILLHAKVLRWFPVQENAAVGELEDIAVLELPEDAPLPIGAQPAPLVLFEEHWGRQVRLHGFSVPAGTYANLTLQGLNTQGLIELHHQGSGVVAPGFSGTAVWSVQENAVCGMAVAVWKELNTAYMIPAAALIQAFPELDRCSRPVNPYRGMEAFREKDARFYFGRETDADELRKKVEQQPFTAVIGASGSGKSSLVFAGLLPILRQSGDWLLAACRPKQQPFHELAASLIPFLYEDELERVKKSRQCAADLLSGELHLPDLLQRITERNDCRRFLLLVDQFEELYTLNADRALARAFVAQLLAAQAEGFRAVITLRADFLEAALGDEAFAKTLNACQPLYLSPLDSHGLRLAVERPAELLGIRFEAGLADLIVADVGNEPGSLPLLEFCLTQLWEQQEHMKITHKAYTAIGGVRQALARHADTVLAEFEQEAVRRIFLKLVRPGQGTEDTRQVAALADFQEEQRGLIKQLADRRLLVTSGDEAGQQVEVAHEALIRHWQTLRKWVDAERDFLVWRDKLRVLLRQWQESGHDEGALLRGLPLGEALQWRGNHAEHLDEKELRFIRESEAARRKQRRRKGIAAGAGLLLAAAVMVVFFVLWKDAEKEKVRAEEQKNKAEQQTLAANYNLAKAFEEKTWAALKTAKEQKERGGAYKNAMLFAWAALAQQIEKNKDALNSSLVGHLFTTDIFQYALVEQWISNAGGSVYFSPDGMRIVSTGDETVRIWDITGKSLSVFKIKVKGHERISSVGINPNGKTLASAAFWDNTVRLWDIATGKELNVFKGHEKSVTNVAFSPDGTRLASVSDDKTVRLWDVATGNELNVFKGHEKSVTNVAFSPDGTRLASALDDKTVRLWDVATGNELKILKGHEKSVNSVSFSPDGTRLASVSDDKTVRLWDVATGNELKVFKGHTEPVSSVSFSPNGRHLASASLDSTIRLWDIVSRNSFSVFKGHDFYVSSVSFSPDGAKLVSSSRDGTIRLWGIADKANNIIILDGDRYDVMGISFSPDGKQLAAAYINQTVGVWDVATGQELSVLKGHEGFITSLAFSSDQKTLASASKDNTVRLWDIKTGQQMQIVRGHSGDINSVSFSPDGKILASASDDKTVQLWDIEKDKELAVLKGHIEGVKSVSFSPDGKILASASDDKTVRLWDIETCQELTTFNRYSEGVKSVSFSPDGKILASVSGGKTVYNTIQLLDIEHKKQVVEFEKDGVRSLSFSPDGKLLAITSSDLQILSTEDGKELAVLNNNYKIVRSMAFSKDGSFVTSASNNPFGGIIALQKWDIKPYQLFLHENKPTNLYRTFMEGVKFFWQLDVQGLEIVKTDRRTPADMERFGSLLAPPPPGQSKFDQVLEWAEKQQGK